ncbi:uncharacterized protein TNCV_3663491 [Trichonephila clavipes]|nr:uncharacterized protein TNCV_3663491 [Trichonephila clavipes]
MYSAFAVCVGGTLNSPRAASPLVRFLEGEERLEATDHLQGVLPQNWDGTKPNCIVTLMGLKATANDRIRPPGLSPEHHWYQCSHPEGSLDHGFNRQEQTILTRFRSGHLKSMKFSEGSKSFEICTNCSSEPALPAHILECLGLTKQDLADDPLLGLGLNPGEDMDVCKCIVPARHGGTLNSRRAAIPFVRLVEGEERWEASDHPRVFSL